MIIETLNAFKTESQLLSKISVFKVLPVLIFLNLVSDICKLKTPKLIKTKDFQTMTAKLKQGNPPWNQTKMKLNFKNKKKPIKFIFKKQVKKKEAFYQFLLLCSEAGLTTIRAPKHISLKIWSN